MDKAARLHMAVNFNDGDGRFMKDMLVVFSHGKESGPLGSKIRALMKVAESHGAEVLSVDYREHPVGTFHDQNAPGEADRRVDQLLATPLPEHRQLVLVGSSMGGYVSTVASKDMAAAGLFLLAPAFYLPGYTVQDISLDISKTMVIHGWRDDVVPVQNSIRFAQRHRCGLYLIDGDHRLNEALPKIEALFALFLAQVSSAQD
jgi:pimeloyl-ACP methyl ester carboxylesterase